MAQFLFGPITHLMLVDLGPSGFTADKAKIGGEHQSLDGTTTLDVSGVKGRWRIPIAGLDPGALSWFEMAYRGALGAPLYFVDLQRVNMLTAPVSSAGSAWSPTGTVLYTASNGTVTQSASPSVFLPTTVAGQTVQTPGPMCRWVWGSTAAGTLDLGERVPVRPGDTLTFSIYVASGSPTLQVTPFAADGTAGTPAGTATVTVNTTPRRLHTTYTVPASGVASVRPLVRHAANQFTAFTASQLEFGLTTTPWTLGAGVPKVLVPTFPLKHAAVGKYSSADLDLVEA